MIEKENLDIRTTTMGISLLDCFGRDHKAAAARVYDKITGLAEKLVETANEVGEDYGIKIVNKRISVTPIALAGANSTEEWLLYAKALDNAAKAVGVDIIGGFSALVQKGCTASDESFIEAVPYALAETDAMCSSINLGSTKAGINMDAVAKMGKIIRQFNPRIWGTHSVQATAAPLPACRDCGQKEGLRTTPWRLRVHLPAALTQLRPPLLTPTSSEGRQRLLISPPRQPHFPK